MGEPSDETAIIGVQNAYAAAIDQRDWVALRRCFAPGASISFGRPTRIGDLEEFLDWAPPFHAAFGPTLHQVSTHLATVAGDVASARCTLHAVLVEPALDAAQTIVGEYRDEFAKVDGAWRIRSRRFQAVWRHSASATIPDPS